MYFFSYFTFLTSIFYKNIYLKTCFLYYTCKKIASIFYIIYFLTASNTFFPSETYFINFYIFALKAGV